MLESVLTDEVYVTDEVIPVEFAGGMTLIEHIPQKTNQHARK